MAEKSGLGHQSSLGNQEQGIGESLKALFKRGRTETSSSPEEILFQQLGRKLLDHHKNDPRYQGLSDEDVTADLLDRMAKGERLQPRI